MKKFDSVHWLMFLSGLLLGLGVMLIATTALAEPRLKCTWPDTNPPVSSTQDNSLDT